MATSLEVSITRALAPILVGLLKGAGDSLKNSFKKWSASSAPSRLARKLARADRIKTIWSPDKEASLLSIYYPSKLLLNNNAATVTSLRDLPEENIVIEGIVGHGKSMFLRYLYLQELAGDGKGSLPLFIELRTLSVKRDFSAHLLDALDKLDVEPTNEIFDYLARSGRLVLLLDGFDELDDDLVKATIESIEFLLEKYESLRVIVTSRPSADIQKSRLFSTVSLLGLEQQDYNGFLEKLGVDSEKTLEITEAIRNSPSDVVNLIKTPLMMTLLLMVYESEKEIPSELSDFFDKLFSTMFTRHDRLKAGFVRKHHSGISERHLQRLFEAFCFVTMQNGFGRSLNANQFALAFDKACRYSHENACDIENFRKDIVRVACLMLEEGYDLTTFLHKSIAEYFAAAFVRKLSDDFAQKFYQSVDKGPRNWEGVITFLEGIDEYRIAKYYWNPGYDALFEKLSAFKKSDQNNWIDFFSANQPNFGVSYTVRGRAKEDVGLRASSWGSYTHHYPICNLIHAKIVRAAIDGLKQNLPETLAEEILVEQSRLFRREEKSEGDVEYKILFKDAIEEYGESGVSEKFRQLDVELLRRSELVKVLIEHEEAREKIFEDDLFNS